MSDNFRESYYWWFHKYDDGSLETYDYYYNCYQIIDLYFRYKGNK